VLLKLARKGLVELISANFMMQFVGFGLLIFLPRFVSEADIGRIKVLQTYTDLLVVIAGLGMNTAVLKLCSDRRPHEDRIAIFRLAAMRTAVAGVLATLVVFLAVRSGLWRGDPTVLNWLPVYAVIVPFAAVSFVAAAYLQALKRIKEMARAQVLVRIQSVVLILLSTWQFGLQGFVLSSVAAFVLGLWPFVRMLWKDFTEAGRTKMSAAFRSIAKFSVLGNVMNSIGKYADIYVLGLFALDPVELGYYSLATIFVIPASVVTASIQTIVTPYLSEGSADRAWFAKTLVRTQLQTVGVAVVAALVARLGATGVVALLYAPGYEAALGYLDVLLIFFVVRSSYAVLAAGHIALGLTKYNFIASAIMAVLAVTFTFVALDMYGFMGVAWAKVITGAIMIVIYSLLAKRAVRVAVNEV
jgi:O-antigen/teichoic acid export membrane protein